MYNLLYTSNSTVQVNSGMLDTILLTARENNNREGITGMLLYSQGSFVQLLEGDEENVKKTFYKISCDTRHNNIEVVMETTASDRYFPDWQMGFKWLEKADLNRIDNHENKKIKDYFKCSQPFKLIKLMSMSHWNQ